MNKRERKAYFQALGQKGGKKTARKYGKKHMAEIGRKGAVGRLEMLKKADPSLIKSK